MMANIEINMNGIEDMIILKLKLTVPASKTINTIRLKSDIPVNVSFIFFGFLISAKSKSSCPVNGKIINGCVSDCRREPVLENNSNSIS